MLHSSFKICDLECRVVSKLLPFFKLSPYKVCNFLEMLSIWWWCVLT